ncbi:FimV/HubP family polar landmark protein [Parendozoicomonas haliclonae]|uniref:FimV N-terminal domain-containing protein n=1 Tax=Parendozoicomonas haliclonae TaxID=1960125 RepID=A0A1X7AKN2_9GAMM|nr:FimV/HubP family polar landmark protein [Parendozoicomonas haliclonae]SMA47467.1 hypothetical protein EHSB41UT_02428 [Parendozoicomonas haliclonae]
MLRKLAAAIAIAGGMGSMMASTSAHALGLGEIELDSALNQPLKADIELVELRDLTAAEILPNLATRDDFDRAGVERPYFLSKLRFETVTRDDGSVYIRVSSRQPVIEPYLNFLVEVHWPNGRLLREYTLLLDPPSFSDSVVKGVAGTPPKTVTAGEPEKAAAPEVAAAPVLNSRIPQAQPETSGATGSTYRVKKDDTLWEVALNTRPGRDVSPIKMMAALQQQNPSAFIKGNINLLKQGSLLTIPDRSAIEAMDASAAAQNVSNQNKEWKSGQVQVDATRQTEVRETARGVVEDDRLSIVSGSTGDNGEGADQGDGNSAGGSARELEDALIIKQEQLDSLSRENTDLKDRLGDLEEQIATLERLVTLKNDQLVAAQTLADENALAANANNGGAATDAKPAEEIDYNFSDGQEVADAGAEVAVTPAGGPPAQEPAKAAKPKTPPPPPPPAPEPGFLDKLLANPLYLGGGAAVLLLLGLLGVVAKRRRDAEPEDDSDNTPSPMPTDSGDLADELPEADDLFADSTSDADAAQDQDEPDLDIDKSLLDPQGGVAPETADALGEADIYIAYGRYDQAAELLNQAIAAEPERADLRIKQLEVLAELQDAEGFVTQEMALKDQGSSEGVNRAAELRGRFPAEALAAVAATTVVTAVAAEAQAADPVDSDIDMTEFDAMAAEEGLEFDLPDVDLTEEPAAEVSNDEDDDFGLDFGDLEAELDDQLTDMATDSETQSVDNEALEFGDIELEGLEQDLDAELAEEPEATVEADSNDLPDLEFDIALDDAELDVADETAAPVAEEPVTEADAESVSDFDSELEQLDAELADLSVDMDQAEIDKALAPEETAEVAAEPEAEEVAEPSAELSLDDLDHDLDIEFESSDLEGLDEAEPEVASVEVEEAPVVEAVEDAEPAAPATDALETALADLGDVDADGDLGQMEEDFAFLNETDETATKLDLARAYMEMGDEEGAKDILDEVSREGSEAQQAEARELIGKMGS